MYSIALCVASLKKKKPIQTATKDLLVLVRKQSLRVPSLLKHQWSRYPVEKMRFKALHKRPCYVYCLWYI